MGPTTGELVSKIREEFGQFNAEVDKDTGASHRRARKSSSELTKLLKQFRAQSVKDHAKSPSSEGQA